MLILVRQFLGGLVIFEFKLTYNSNYNNAINIDNNQPATRPLVPFMASGLRAQARPPAKQARRTGEVGGIVDSESLSA